MVLNGFLHLDKDILGSGAFCSVKRAVFKGMVDEDGNFCDD